MVVELSSRGLEGPVVRVPVGHLPEQRVELHARVRAPLRRLRRLLGEGGDVRRPSKAARDADAARRLWALSVELTGLEPAVAR